MITYSCIEETKAYWYAWNIVEGNIIACEDVFDIRARVVNIDGSESENNQGT